MPNIRPLELGEALCSIPTVHDRLVLRLEVGATEKARLAIKEAQGEIDAAEIA